jgi:hypothetical protein
MGWVKVPRVQRDCRTLMQQCGELRRHFWPKILNRHRHLTPKFQFFKGLSPVFVVASVYTRLEYVTHGTHNCKKNLNFRRGE